MQGFKKCDKGGHFYKENLPSCPYCKNQVGAKSPDGTIKEDPTSLDGGGKTQPTEPVTQNLGGLGAAGDRTQVYGGKSSNAGTPPISGAPASEGPSSFDRTFISGITGPGSNDARGSKSSDGSGSSPRMARKIVGWIISFTIDPMGVDYRIYEGNNIIGRDSSCSIKLVKDSTISSKHLTILFRSGKFWARDEMSANGSFLNGEEMEIQKAYALNDGDELRLGNTIFKFKTCV